METLSYSAELGSQEPDRSWSSEALDGCGKVVVELWIEPANILVYTVSDAGEVVPMSDPHAMLGTVLGFMCDMQDRIADLEETVALLSSEPS